MTSSGFNNALYLLEAYGQAAPRGRGAPSPRHPFTNWAY